jgi:hypothetical protein
MTDNERELLNIIRSHNDPERAVSITIEVILGFLVQDESSQEQQAVCFRERA